MKIFEFLTAPVLIAALIGAVNIFTAVTKKVADVKKAERVVLFWAELLSVLAACAAVWLEGWVNPFVFAAAVVCGLLVGVLVAYAAMYGYDELYEKAMKTVASVFTYLWRGSNDKQPGA